MRTSAASGNNFNLSHAATNLPIVCCTSKDEANFSMTLTFSISFFSIQKRCYSTFMNILPSGIGEPVLLKLLSMTINNRKVGFALAILDYGWRWEMSSTDLVDWCKQWKQLQPPTVVQNLIHLLCSGHTLQNVALAVRR